MNGFGISDAAKRMSDIINGKAIAHPFDELVSSWMAFKLSDGSSDGNLYPSRADAERHQIDPDNCAYVSMRDSAKGMSARSAQAYLTYCRMAHDNGFKLPDPERRNRSRHILTPLSSQDWRSQISRLLAANGKPITRYKG